MKPVVLLIIETILLILINLSVGTYLSIFIKKQKTNKYRKHYLNKKILISTMVVLETSIIPLIIGVFGSLQHWNRALDILMIVFALVEILGVSAVIFFFIQYYAIGISDTHIEFLGEKIDLSKIFDLTVSKNKKRNKYFINYYEGRRGQKKYSFYIHSLAYKFIIQNEDIIKEQMLVNANKKIKTSSDEQNVQEPTTTEAN